MYTSISTHHFSLPTQLLGQPCLSTLLDCLPRYTIQPCSPCKHSTSTFYPDDFFPWAVFCQAHRQYQSILLLPAQLDYSLTFITFIHPPAFPSCSLSLSVVPNPLFSSFILSCKVHSYLCIAVLQKSKL